MNWGGRKMQAKLKMIIQRKMLCNWQLGINLGSTASFRGSVNLLRLWAKFQAHACLYVFWERFLWVSNLLGRFYFSRVSRQSARTLCPRIILARAQDNVDYYSDCFLRLKDRQPSSPRISKAIGKPIFPEACWDVLAHSISMKREAVQSLHFVKSLARVSQIWELRSVVLSRTSLRYWGVWRRVLPKEDVWAQVFGIWGNLRRGEGDTLNLILPDAPEGGACW